MTVDTVLARLRSLADRFDEWERPKFSEPSGLFALSNLERLVDASLPEDVWEFFQQHDEIVAMGIQNGYRLGGTNWLRRMLEEQVFPKTVGDDSRVIPFATDGGGNAFLIGINGEGAWRWDHETGRITQVADSFVAFLSGVADDWEHFAANDTTWRFLA